MKKNRDEVIKLLSNREIKDYGFLSFNEDKIFIFYVIIDTITWEELRNEWLRESIIDIQPWDDDTIRVAIDNVN